MKATGLHLAPSVLVARMRNGIMWVKVSSRNLILVVCGFVSTRVMRAKKTILYLSSNAMPKYSWSKHWYVCFRETRGLIESDVSSPGRPRDFHVG